MKKTALITGANKGIGFETSRVLAQKGIKVLMGSRNEERGKAAVEQLQQEGLDVSYILLDVSDPGSIKNAVTHINSNYDTLDILVNNAGIVHQVENEWAGNSIENLPMAALRSTLETNFFGAVDLTQQLLPLLKKSTQASIVNVSSILGSLALANDETSGVYDVKPFAYNTSKAALNSFTIHLAAALKDTNITVNSAHPGWVKTDMGTDAAPMSISEGAKTIADLALNTNPEYTSRFVHLGEDIAW